MCGRYTLYETEELADRFKIARTPETETLLGQLKKRYNISPSQLAPAIRLDDNGERKLEEMRWGYMPAWARDPKDIFKYKTFNARSEEIFEKRTWKHAIRSRRCLVPSTGFYEWKKLEDGKQPYFIHPKDQTLFAFAGVWGSWRDADGQEWDTYSIITTSPSNDMEAVHTRMPVILHPNDEEQWLNPDNAEPETLMELMRPYDDNGLELFEVSRDVNGSRVDEDTFIQPLNSR